MDLVTEEVEPGVFRIVDDGLHDLSGSANVEYLPGYSDIGLVAGLEGSVWWLATDGFFRLGEERVNAWPTGVPINSPGDTGIEVGPEGTMWIARPDDDLRSFDGQSWTTRRKGPGAKGILGGIEVQRTGSVWVAEKTGKDGNTWRVARLDADGWEVLPGKLKKQAHLEMSIAEDGGNELWAMGPGPRMQRHDGSRWRVQAIPKTNYRRPDLQAPLEAAVGPDGKTLWVLLRSGTELARLDGSGWQVYGPDGLPTIGRVLYQDHHFEVVRDGSLWFTSLEELECVGVANFDGDTVRHFLRDLCVHAMDVAPDGSVWLQAGRWQPWLPEEPTVPVHAYVITPEAVAAAD